MCSLMMISDMISKHVGAVKSVLKKWFKINNIQLVDLLVVWYLVNHSSLSLNQVLYTVITMLLKCNFFRFCKWYVFILIPLAARIKVWVCCLSVAGIAGSNPAGGISVSCECCVLSGRRLSRGPIPRLGDLCVTKCDSVQQYPSAITVIRQKRPDQEGKKKCI